MSSGDPGVDAAAGRAAPLLDSPATHIHGAGSNIRIGVASWTDPTITAPGVFYPPGASSAEGRLRYYSSIFPLVEVDSSYYALPSRRNAELWVERTPPDFRFNIKAYALMTGHPAEISRLPKELKEGLPKDVLQSGRCYAKDLPSAILDGVWQWFVDAVEPLERSGKLGAILLQYPKWFVPGRDADASLAGARKRLGALRAAVEFRNARWLAPNRRDRTFAHLREHALSYVCVDEPQGMPSSVPPVLEVTNGSLALIRFHGHRTDMWERPGIPAVERFRYLYGPGELAEWAPRLADLAREADDTHILFNNCYANYGTTNALEIGELIARIYRG